MLLIKYNVYNVHDARVKTPKPRCTCTRVVLRLYDPPRYGAEHPVDVRFVPTEAERRHKMERQLHDMQISDNIVEVRSTEQFV